MTTSTPAQRRSVPARRTGNVVLGISDLPRATQGRIAQRLSTGPAGCGDRPAGRARSVRPMRPSAGQPTA